MRAHAPSTAKPHVAPKKPGSVALRAGHGKPTPARASWGFAPSAGASEAGLQAKLEVGAPGDEFEKEADHVADRVVRMPEASSASPPGEPLADEQSRRSPIQRRMADHRAAAPSTDDEKKVQRAAAPSMMDDDKKVQRAAAPSMTDDEKKVQRAAAPSTTDDEKKVQRAAAPSMMDDDKKVQRAAAPSTTDDEKKVQRAAAPSMMDDEKKVQRADDFFEKSPPEPKDEDTAQASSAVQTKRRRDRSGERRTSPLPEQFAERLNDARRGGGHELPSPMRGFMESRFGSNFDGIRVHHDSTASTLASSIDARAFTVGRHIFFKQGEFQPHTQQGQKLVAHELTHVLQQRGGLHSVQREVLDRGSDDTSEDRSEEQSTAAEQLRFEALAKLFGWRENVTPPLVLEALRDLIDAALHVITSRESLAVFALERPPDPSIRRIIRSSSHELRLELSQTGDGPQAATRWELRFFDGTRTPATGGQPVAMGTDEDAISVRDTGKTKAPPAPPAPEPKATAPAAPSPVASTAATAPGGPSAANPAPSVEPEGGKPSALPAGVKATAASGKAAAPGSEATAPAKEAAFPTSPESDPNFQAVKARAEGAAGQSSEHAPGGELAANAKNAAAVNPGEQESKAQSNKTDQMQAAKTKAFDKNAFINKVLERVKATAPGTLDDAKNFKRNHLDDIKGTVDSAASAGTDQTSAELKTVTDTPPNPSAVPKRPDVELKPETVGAPPADVQAGKAVPPERPASQVEGAIEQNSQAAKEQLDALGYTDPEATFAKSNDPEMQATLASKQAFVQDAASAPATYREGEKQLRADGMSEANALGKEQLGGMVASRKTLVGQVATNQRGGKTSSESKRQSVVNEVNRIFGSTETKVRTRLAALKTRVFQTFKVESEQALDTFTSRVVAVEEAWKARGYLDQAADTIGSALLGIPNELEANLQALRNAFIRELTDIVAGIADTVETELQAAKDEIQAGQSELQAFLGGLEPSLNALKEQLSAEFTGKFGALEGQVKGFEDTLVSGLAEQFKARLEQSAQLLNDVRNRNRNFFNDLADGISSVREKTLGVIEKLKQVFADGVDTLMRVLDDPITFAKNFLSGIMQGVQNFAANIGKHLQAGLLEWLTGSLAGAGVHLPTSFDAKSIIGFILELLGLTVDNVKARARVIWGEKIVRAIELGVEGVKEAVQLFNILQTEGVAGLFNFLKEKFLAFKDAALEKIRDAIGLELVEAAIKKIVGLLIPGGAFLQAVLSVVDAVFFFIRNAERLANLVATITSAVKDILAGNVAALAAKVESVLAGAIPTVLDFLATLIGIGGKITAIIQKALHAITQPIQEAIDAVLLAIKKAVGGIVDRVLGKGKPEQAAAGGPPKAMTTEEIIAQVVSRLHQPTQATEPAVALDEKRQQAEALKQEFQPRAPEGKTLSVIFKDKSAEDVKLDHEVNMEVGFSPGTPVSSPVASDADSAVTGVKHALTDLAPLDQSDIQGAIPEWTKRFGFKSLSVAESADIWVISGELAGQTGPKTIATQAIPGTKSSLFSLDWPKPASVAYPTLYFGGRIGTPRRQATLAQHVGMADETGSAVRAFTPHGGGQLPGGESIGIGAAYQVAVGTVVGPLAQAQTPGGKKILAVLEPYGFVASSEGLDGDHVREIQLGGNDVLENLWPLRSGLNRSAGSKLRSAVVKYPGIGKDVPLATLKKKGHAYFFKIASTK